MTLTWPRLNKVKASIAPAITVPSSRTPLAESSVIVVGIFVVVERINAPLLCAMP